MAMTELKLVKQTQYDDDDIILKSWKTGWNAMHDEAAALIAQMQARVDELKPCPFCGGKAISWTFTECGFARSSVHCDDCNIRYYRRTEAEAIEAWNTRTPPKEDPAP